MIIWLHYLNVKQIFHYWGQVLLFAYEIFETGKGKKQDLTPIPPYELTFFDLFLIIVEN